MIKKTENYFLEPLFDRHLKAKENYGYSQTYVYAFGGIALLILFLAQINYVCLTTARSITRAKEVGIRKTIGAERSALIVQFYSESSLYLFISLLISIVLFHVLKTSFIQLQGIKIDSSFYLNQYFLIPVLFITLFSFFFSEQLSGYLIILNI